MSTPVVQIMPIDRNLVSVVVEYNSPGYIRMMVTDLLYDIVHVVLMLVVVIDRCVEVLHSI